MERKGTSEVLEAFGGNEVEYLTLNEYFELGLRIKDLIEVIIREYSQFSERFQFNSENVRIRKNDLELEILGEQRPLHRHMESEEYRCYLMYELSLLLVQQIRRRRDRVDRLWKGCTVLDCRTPGVIVAGVMCRHVTINGTHYFLKKTNRDETFRFAANAEDLFHIELQHQNILPSYGTIEHNASFYAILPVVKSCLYDYIKGHSLSEGEKRRLLRGIVKGIGMMKAKEVSHLNISPYSIYIGEDNEVLIGDFRYARAAGIQSERAVYRNSLHGSTDARLFPHSDFAAPDTIPETYSDYFSLGKVVEFIYDGKPPVGLRNLLISLELGSPLDFKVILSKLAD